MIRVAPVALLLSIAAVSACANGSRESVRNEQGGTLDAQPSRTPDVIFVPTKMEVVEQMLTLAQVDSTDLVYDLGSGDGRIVITAASRRGARGVGIDIDPQRIRESLANADSARVRNRVEFRQADLFRTDLRPATAVTLYLLPSLNVKLRPKLFAELRPGTPVVSNSFEMGDWAPDSAVQTTDRQVYLWYIPANAAGEWQARWGDTTAAANRAELRLTQRYQEVTGSARVGGREGILSHARLRGDSIRFTVTLDGSPMEFTGRVDGATMTGTTGDGATWRATRRGAAGSPLPMEPFRE
jgi:SAM-dependent methyltransferase